ncbi:hypothetical protein Syun_009791 [Stephania yunnanensis]|uniref:Uncharacterized protein n=1 Tax=Stephania yunnanensis TaxID=152371 RepID=A0AAP0KFA7_9MAGN
MRCMRNQMRTLSNQELVFKNQSALAKSIHMMERTMSRRHRRQGGVEVPVPSTQMQLPSNHSFDGQLPSGQDYTLYDPVMSYKFERIDPLADNDVANSG